MNLRFIIFFAVLFTLLASMALFVYRRTRTVFAPPEWVLRLMRIALIGGLLLFAGARMLGHTVLGRPAGALGGTLSLAVIICFALMLGAYLLERLVSFAARLGGVTAPSSADAAAMAATATPELEPLEDDATLATKEADDSATGTPEALDGQALLGRRGFVAKASTGTALALGAGSSMYAGVFGRHDYTIEEVPIKLAKLPPALDGFTIVQFSDVHLGTYVGPSEIRSALALAAKAKPDLIVLTGDLLDHDADYAQLLGEMARKLGDLAPVYAIPGNHDYYAGIAATLGGLRKAGAQVLFNQGQPVAEGKIALLGVDDVWARRSGHGRGPDVQSALATVSPDLPRVLLCHNPVYFPEASPHVDLQLSGHTHGGQINLGVRPADIVLPYGYVEGHYRRDDAQLWVNRGFGTAGPPARLQAPPEVTKVILTV